MVLGPALSWQRIKGPSAPTISATGQRVHGQTTGAVGAGVPSSGRDWWDTTGGRAESVGHEKNAVGLEKEAGARPNCELPKMAPGAADPCGPAMACVIAHAVTNET